MRTALRMSRPTVAALAIVASSFAACHDDRSIGNDEQPTVADCAPMRAAGNGQCDLGVGVIWDGTQCVGIAGCECVGEDCDRIFANIEECEATYAGTGCMGTQCDSTDDPTPCGPPSTPITPGLICLAPNFGCGPGVCSEAQCSPDTGPVCGCDFVTYESMCAAFAAGTSIQEFQACATP
jgi:hypothetical protein